MDVQTDERQPLVSGHQTDILSGYKIGLKQNRDTLRYEIEQHTQLTGCEGSIGCFDVTYTIRNEGDRVELKNEVTRYCVCSECRKEWFERKSGNQAKEQKRDTLLDKIEQHTQLTGCEGSITCFDVTYTKSNEGERVELENEVTKYYVCIECRKEWFQRKSGNQAEELNRDPLLDEISQHTQLTGCGGIISYFNVTYKKRNGGDRVELKDELTKYYVCIECRKEWLKWKSGNQKPNRVTPLDENEQHTQLTGCRGSISCFDVTYTQRNGGDPVELKNEPTKYYVCSECRKEWFKCKSEDREVKVTSQPHYFSPQLCCLVPSDAGTFVSWGKVQHNESATRLKAGDHVAWVRCCGYWHHGIVEYIANNTLHLIEFSLSCRSCKICRSEQSISSISSPMYKAYYTEGLLDQNPPDLVIVRAVSRLQEADNSRSREAYNLLTNNCEHFATFCKTGVYRSDQIYQTQLGLQSLILKSFILLIRLVCFFAIKEIFEADGNEQPHNSTQVNDLSSTQVDAPLSINTYDIIGALVYIVLEIAYLFIALVITWCFDIPQLYNSEMGWPKCCCGHCRKPQCSNPCRKATIRMVLHTMFVIVGVVSFSVFLKAHLKGKNAPWSHWGDIFKEIGLGVAGGFIGSILGFLLFTFCPSVFCCFHLCKCCCRASLAIEEDTQAINQIT